MKVKKQIGHRRNVSFRKEKSKPGFFNVDEMYCWLSGAKQPDITWSNYVPVTYKTLKK